MHYATNIGVRPPGFEVAKENGTQWVKAGGVPTVNSTETHHAACLAGLGIIQAPRVGVRDALHGGKLVEILPQYRAKQCRYRCFIRIAVTSRAGCTCLWSG